MTLKKALVAITVVAMLFGMVGVAFAGGFSDITDSTTAAAATRLNALGIINGFPDGSFQPDGTITRAQFAAVAVRALGLDSAASYAKGATKFSDVTADHWASGYINIATQQGVISGYPDGTFGPEKPVSYAEALTMIVRVLGYAPMVEGKGAWPANYIAKAAQLGFTSGIAFNGNGPATRGNVALFVDSSLTEPMLYEDGITLGQPTYTTTPVKTLLGTNLGANETSGQLVSSPDLLGTTTAAVYGGSALSLASGVSVSGLLGQNVNLWTNKSGYLVLAQSTELSSNVLTDKISAYDGASITLASTLTKYTVASGAKIFRNGATGGTPAKGDEVTVVLDSTGAVKAIVATGYSIGVVNSVDTDGKIITLNGGTALNFSDSTKTYAITLSGKAIGLSDVAKGDVLQYYSALGNYVVVDTRNVVAGTLTQVNADGTTVIGGTTYSPASAVDYVAGSPTTFNGYIGSNVNVFLDKYGKIAHIETVGNTAPIAYGVVTTPQFAVGAASGLDYYFKVMKSDGTSATLKLASSFSGTSTSPTYPALAAGNVITYTVDSTGVVNSVSVVTLKNEAFTTFDNVNDVVGTASVVGVKLVTSGTIIIDLRTPLAPATMTAGTFFGLTGASVTGTLVADSSVTARAAVIVVQGGTSAVNNAGYSYVTALYQDSNGWNATVFSGGSTVTYSVYQANASDLSVVNAVYTDTAQNLTLSGSTITGAATQADVNVLVSGWDHNVAISFDATNNILTYKTVKADASMIATQYALFNSKTMFVDYTGTAPVISTSAAIKAGHKVELYDFNNDGIVDIVVVD